VPLEELRYRSYPSFTRVVIETGGRLAYAVVAGEEEVRVRLPGLSLAGSRVEEIGDGLVQEIRLEPVGDTAVLRVILEGTAGEVKHAVLQDPSRLVLDIYRPKESGGEPGRGGPLQPLRLVVLDAGHGGHDSGAIGPSGVLEKDVVLDVTRRVARMVEPGLGVKVVLSRDSDVFVPLRERTNFANRQRADLFVSIHANAHPQAVSEGVETYFLSSEASDNAARQVAAIENGVVQLESNGGPRQRGDVLKSILWDLAQSEFQEESSFMAETVQDSMSRSLSLVNRGVKQAGFYVLGGAAMPAILIEIGFLTNRKEEKKLATPEHREALARAIYAGLAEYKRRYDQRLRTAQSLPVKPVKSGPAR
jgi:N-acetylmuramoyl-L-alanine amidase